MVPELSRAAGRGARGTPATVALTRAGVAFSLHPYDHDPTTTSYGEEAAAALGLDPAHVLKTLVAQADGDLVLALVPVTARLDLKALAAAAGRKRAALADPARAQRATGYVVGGISPLGQRTRLPTFVEESATRYETVYVSAGRRGLDLGLSPADLLTLTSGRAARLVTG